MISWHTALAFGAASAVLIAIPGPSVMFILSRALQHGRRGALITVVGNATGVFLTVVAVAFGLGALVAASSLAFTVIKLVGGAYLVYLGVQAWRHRREPLAMGVDAGSDDAHPWVSEEDAVGRTEPGWKTTTLVRESMLVGITNPKTLVFMAALLPQFVDPARGPAWAQMLVLGVEFAALALIGDGFIAIAASGAREWFATSPKRVERMRAAGAGALTALGLALMASRRAA